MSTSNKSLLTGGLIDIEVNLIINKTNNLRNSMEYQVLLHTPKKDIELTIIKSIETLRDYNENIGDYWILEFSMEAGTYAKHIHPYRDNLEVTIIKSYKYNIKEPSTWRYKLVIMSQTENMDSSQYSKATEEELNKTSMLNVTGQLVYRELEGIRSIYVDGVYKQTTLKNMILALFYDAGKKITIEGNKMDLCIDMTEPANRTRYRNVLIPTGITLADLPSYLQNVAYGMYNGGIGTYLQEYNGSRVVFIYPLYSTDAYEKAKDKRLTIFHANTARLDHIENTFTVDGDNVKIIATSQAKNKDMGTNTLISQGDGIMYNQSEQVLNRNFEIQEDGIMFDKTKQLSASTIVNRRDGQVKTVYVGADSNLYRQRTQILKNTLSFIQIPWKFSNQDIIYPGMPCCYIFEDSVKGLVKLNGTVQAIYTKYDGGKKTHVSILIIAVASPNVWDLNKKE